MSWVDSWVQGAGCGSPTIVLGAGSQLWRPMRGPGCRVPSIPPPPTLVTPLSFRQPVLVQRGRFGRFLRKVRRFRPSINFDVHARARVRVRLG